MHSNLSENHKDHYLIMIDELYEIHKKYGSFLIKAYFKTANGIKLYYDYSEVDQSDLNGSYDRLDVLELIYYLDEMK